ncbi:MAG: RDD family protein [Chloroflexi bacterium]|nr:RDD family protein [Chloroflexota bacterium]
MTKFHQLYTAQNVPFTYPVAGLWERFTAALIDTALIALLTVGGWLAVTAVAAPALEVSASQRNWLLAGMGLLIFMAQWGYHLFFEWYWHGQTPGKRLLHLRVIRLDGTVVQPTESTIRNLIRIIDYIPGNYFIGFVSLYVTRRFQRLGDVAAGTIVINERLPITLSTLLAGDNGEDSNP